MPDTLFGPEKTVSEPTLLQKRACTAALRVGNYRASLRLEGIPLPVSGEAGPNSREGRRHELLNRYRRQPA